MYALSKEGTFYQINILSHENFKSIENEDKIYRMKIYFIERKYVLIEWKYIFIEWKYALSNFATS